MKHVQYCSCMMNGVFSHVLGCRRGSLERYRLRAGWARLHWLGACWTRWLVQFAVSRQSVTYLDFMCTLWSHISPSIALSLSLLPSLPFPPSPSLPSFLSFLPYFGKPIWRVWGNTVSSPSGSILVHSEITHPATTASSDEWQFMFNVAR